MQEDTLQTLVLIKPDALKNSLTGYVLSQLSEFQTGLTFAATKVVCVTRMLAEEHYAEHKGKFFFPPLIEMITGKLHFPNEPDKQKIIAIVYRGPDAVRKVRDVVGPTNPNNAREERPGCIRSLGAVIVETDESGKVVGDRMDNLIHASAKPDEAEREIKLWFRPEEFPPAVRAFAVAHSEDHFYFNNGKISRDYESGSICVLAPGDVVWQSDLDALRAAEQGRPAATSLNAVVAKYLLNRKSAASW